MDIEDVREYCLGLVGTTEGMPFDENTIVFKVISKMYCLEGLSEKRINIKAEPEQVIHLIESYQGIKPGWHMNKKHWVTVELENFTDDSLLKDLILDSYELVIQKMTKKEKDLLKQLKTKS